MNFDISFETTLNLLAWADAASLLLLIAASQVCLAVIETIEEVGKY